MRAIVKSLCVLFPLGALAALILWLGLACAEAATVNTLYRFCAGGPPCVDGAYPGGLIADDAGNLFGTTQIGGARGGGSVFELTPDGTETVLYSFCSQAGCADGDAPVGGLIMDAAGNLYGTTEFGGPSRAGTVFEVAPDGTQTVLYSFCAKTKCVDGSQPTAGLIIDAAGNLYGTTSDGGRFGGGTAFELTSGGVEIVLHSFCAQSGCADGKQPVAGLTMDAAGNLYGTTAAGGGGIFSEGTVFELTPNPRRIMWTERVLYSFCSEAGCSDGAGPVASLLLDAAGNLFGTTEFGGQSSLGTVFKLAPDGTERVLYRFDSARNSHPVAALVADGAGALYGTAAGTTRICGTHGQRCTGPGTVFRLLRDRATRRWSFELLADLRGSPQAGLVVDVGGNLDGTVFTPGKCLFLEPGIGCGKVFQLTP